MKMLCDYVDAHARSGGKNVVIVSSFLNHNIDTYLMKQIGKEFAQAFCTYRPTKILTLEASGIAPALATAFELGIPLVFAKKSKGKKSKILSDDYTAKVVSFTGRRTNTICVNKEYITSADRVLIIDDFLATGAATRGLINICCVAGADIAGIGATIEKTNQRGRANVYELLNSYGFNHTPVVSLCGVCEDAFGSLHVTDPDAECD